MKSFVFRHLLPAAGFFLLSLCLLAFQRPSAQMMETIQPNPQAKITTETAPFKGTDLETFDRESPATAHIVLQAFRDGHPAKISGYGYDERAQDWFIVVGEHKFLWARGRILPEGQAHEAENWRHYIDYLYPRTKLHPENYSPELVAEIRRTSDPDFRAGQKSYNVEFYHALYGGRTRDQLEQRIVPTKFLGRRVNLHEDIVKALSKAEQEIRHVSKINAEVRTFIKTIGSVEGYNWRKIRDRQDRSFHSWGLALDILPEGWQQKNLYWNWLSEWNPDWMLLPPDQQWMPPEPVVKIFERHGFVWGGKWLQWDNIHFEYRPELILLQKYQ